MKLASGLAFAAAFVALAAAAPAKAVEFDVTATSFTADSGYGTDANESAATLLDVMFSTSIFSAENFDLTFVGQDETFDFGTVNFIEPNAHGGITAAEQDDLEVSAFLTFTNPLNSTEELMTTGVAALGPVNDPGGPTVGIDYTLAWTPILVNFGVGGQFQIDLADLTFTTNGLQTLTATITLLALPEDSGNPTTNVPEPGTLAIFGVGLLTFGALARRRRHTR